MKKLLIGAIVALAAVATVQLWVIQDRTGQKNEISEAAPKDEAPIGGAFTLTDQTGKTRHESDFHGRIMLVSFGFTHCPDICPVTVATLSKTMELLGANGAQVAPLFISIDPERDTPQVLVDYLKNFDPRLVGLTGTELQVKQVADAYKVYYARAVEDATQPAGKEYSIDHSGYIYMMSKEGQFMRVFPYNVPEQELSRAIESALR